MDMNQMLRQVQQMQTEMERLQKEAASETVEASAGGGMVTAKANGAREIVSIEIKPEAIDPDDPEMLEDLVVAATNEALRSVDRMLQAKLGGLMGGLGDFRLPGM
jgi:DNA-binding YbaB/EbfC family protein